MNRSVLLGIVLLVSACGKNVAMAPTIDKSTLPGTWCLKIDKSISPEERILKFTPTEVTWTQYTPGDRATTETVETYSFEIQRRHLKVKLSDTTSREIVISKQQNDRLEGSETFADGASHPVFYRRVEESDAAKSDFVCP